MVTTPAGGGFGRLFSNIASTVTAAQTQAMVASTQALASQVGARQVKVEVDTLQGFKSKVDVILQELDSSPAAQSNISRQELQCAHLGEGFGQASDVTSAYGQVHANLQQLSQALGLQIQAMSASIDMAAKGYQNADEEQKQAFQSVLNQAAGASQVGGGGSSGSPVSGGGTYASPVAYGGGSGTGGGGGSGGGSGPVASPGSGSGSGSGGF